MTTSNNWDQLSNHFNVYLPNVDKGVAANIDQTWPTLEPILKELRSNSSILDYGCGTGALCNRLHSLGFKVSGADISSEMIKIARSNSPESIIYWTANNRSLDSENTFSLITSSMVFQFVEDLESLLLQLRQNLNPDGILWFSVHNDSYVTHNTNSHTKFENFSEKNGIKTATMILSGVPITTYIRSAEIYEDLFKVCGLQKILHWNSEPYADGTPPKYLVQGYRLGEG